MGHCILTVDDSSTMRQMITFTLKGANFEVLEAGDGVEALEVAKGKKLSLIITDVNMPRMDGITLVQRLRALLIATQTRPALFGCHGLHEWAMVYRQTPDEVRHNAWPLRFASDELARIVESLPNRIHQRCLGVRQFGFCLGNQQAVKRVFMQ